MMRWQIFCLCKIMFKLNNQSIIVTNRDFLNFFLYSIVHKEMCGQVSHTVIKQSLQFDEKATNTSPLSCFMTLQYENYSSINIRCAFQINDNPWYCFWFLFVWCFLIAFIILFGKNVDRFYVWPIKSAGFFYNIRYIVLKQNDQIQLHN